MFTGLTAHRIALWVLDVLRPEILSRRKPQSARLHDGSTTAWLDGLRGWAALVVVFFHVNAWTHPAIKVCYGAALPNGDRHTGPAAWPIIRILFSGGNLSVLLFFTISGYVVTKRLISFLHEERQAEFAASLHSAICRRPFRLYLPVLGSTLTTITVWHITGLPSPAKSSYFLELKNWVMEAGKFFFLYRGEPFSCNLHTWSIPFEFKGSLALFAWLHALSQTSNKTRLLLTFGMIWYLVFGVAEAPFATFFTGMVVAELDLIAAGSIQMSLPWDGLVNLLKKHSVVRGAILHLILMSGLYLGGQPEGDGPDATIEAVLGNCHGWINLSRMIPFVYEVELGPHVDQHRVFWQFWASMLLFFACKEIGWLRRGLEGSFSQYLGRHSFALYLLHNPVMSLFSEPLFYLTHVVHPQTHDGPPDVFDKLSRKWYDSSWFPFTDSGPYGLEPNYLFCVVLSGIVFLYVAELGTKIFDQPSVLASRWIYGRFLKAR